MTDSKWKVQKDQNVKHGIDSENMQKYIKGLECVKHIIMQPT